MHETVPYLVLQSLTLVATTALESRHALHNQFVVAHTALHSFLQDCFYYTTVQVGAGCCNQTQVAQGLNNRCAFVLVHLVEGIYSAPILKVPQ